MATYKSIRYLVPDEVVEHTDSINALADVDTSTVAPEVGQTLKWSAANSRWQPADMEEAAASGTQKAIMAFGNPISGGVTNISNLVSSSGVVATDTTGVGTARAGLAAAGYGSDKAIFGFGNTGGNETNVTNVTNLVSNAGVVATDTTGVGTARRYLAAAGFGGDKAIFGFGSTGNYSNVTNVTNLVSNAGVVATDTTGVGEARYYVAAAGFGGDKAIFGFGWAGLYETNTTNLVSNVGVVATDTTGVGTDRPAVNGCTFGGDKAIFAFGWGGYNGGTLGVNITNLVSNTGVVATDTTTVGTGRGDLASATYGVDKGIFAFGISATDNYSGDILNMSNLLSNTGVIASDTTGVGTARNGLAAAGYSTTA